MYNIKTISHLELEISSHCNSKCPQCPRYDMQGEIRKDLEVTHIEKKILFNLPISFMDNLKSIALCGNFGDPLMHPDLDDILDFFYKQDISISTNASLRNTKWWSDLGKKKNITVKFCIDGIGETHEIYRRNTSYEKIIENAKNFIDSGGKASWQFIVFKHNENQIQQAKNLSKKLGFQNIVFMYSDRFDTFNNWKVFEKKEHLYDLEKADKQITLREKTQTPEGKKYWQKLFQLKKKGEIKCIWSEQKKIYIHSNGTVFPCCHIGNILSGRPIEKSLYKKIIKDWQNINLKYNSFVDIIEGPFYKEYFVQSLKNSPHPVCIETCDPINGKFFFNQKNLIKY